MQAHYVHCNTLTKNTEIKPNGVPLREIVLHQELNYLKFFEVGIGKFGLKPPSSRGLGHLPFTEETGIRIPLGVRNSKFL